MYAIRSYYDTAADGGPEPEQLDHRADLPFGKTDVQIKGCGQGQGHCVPDLVKKDKRQNPDGIFPGKIFSKRVQHSGFQGLGQLFPVV